MKKFKYITCIFIFLICCFINVNNISADSNLADSCVGLSATSCNTYDNCVWNSEYNYCNINSLTYVQCGDSYDIPSEVPYFMSLGITILKTLTPIILIIVSMITLVKAVAANSEDAINKAKKGLIGKFIAAVLVFFVISIVQFVILKVADSSDHDSVQACLNCFLNNSCGATTYYIDGFGNCFNASTNNQITCPTS
jgi:hypothetical protein